MNDNLQLDVEFKINSPEVKAATAQVKAEIAGVVASSEQAQQRVSDNLAGAVGGIGSNSTQKNAVNVGIIENFRKQIAEARKIAETATNETTIELANAKIQQYEKEIARLSVIGKQGFDDLGNKISDSIEKPIGKLQRLQKVAEMYANMSASSTNPEIISKYNKKLQETQLEIGRVQNIGKAGFDELGNAIQKSESFVGKLWSGIYQIANILPGLGVAGLLAFALDPLIAYLSKLDLFKEKLSEVQKQNKVLGESLASGDYAKAVVGVNSLRINLDLAKKGFYDKKAVVDEYNKSIGVTAGQVKTLDEVEANLVKNAPDYIRMTLYKAAAQKALEEASQKALEKEKEKLKSDDEVIGGGDKLLRALTAGDTKNKKLYEKMYSDIAKNNRNSAVLALVEEENTLEKIATGLQGKAAELAKKMGGTLGADTSKKTVANQSLENAQNLQQRLIEFQAEYNRKSKEKDEEELQALRDKFVKMSKEVDDFNKNPKNKVKVDGSGLNATRDKAIEDLTFRQQTEKLKISLEEQKGLWERFEEYKKNFGEEKAKERFAKELDVNKSYIAVLTEEYNKLSGKDASKLSGAEGERLEALKKLLSTAKTEKLKADDELYKQALDAAKTYNDKIVEIEKDFEQKRNELAKNKADTPERLIALDKAKKVAIDAAKDEALQKTEIYQKLAIDTIELTRTQVIAQLKVLKELLKNANLPDEIRKAIEGDVQKLEYTLKIGIEQSNLETLKQQIVDLTAELNQTDSEGKSIVSDKERKRILSALTEIQAKIKAVDTTGDGVVSWSDKVAKNFEYLKGSSQEVAEGLSKDFSRLSSAFGDFSNKVGGSNTELGKSLESLSKLASVGSSAAQSVAGFASGDIVGGVSGALGAIGGIISMVSEMDAEYKNFYKNIVEGERKYQEALIERQLVEAKTNPIKFKALASEISIVAKQVADYKKEYKEIFETLQAQPYVFEVQQEKLLGITIANHNVLASLKGKTFAEIKQLLLEGRLLDGTKELAERLVDLEQKGFDATQALADLSKQAAEIFTGTTADSLTESLLTMFKEGKTGVQDLADFFEQTMKDAALSIFKNKVLSEAMNSFYDEFTKATDGGNLDANKVAQLKTYFDSLVSGANSQFAALQQITGLNLTNSSSSSSSSTGGMVGYVQRSITETTASEWIGLIRNQYDLSKKSLGVQTDMLSSMKAWALNLLAIEKNTADTVAELKNAVVELKGINANTKGNGYDRGF